MKTIQAIPIWDNGKTEEGVVLHTHAFDVNLNKSCSFYYSISSVNTNGEVAKKLKEGNLHMDTKSYSQWAESDDYAWDWVAAQLGLVITGDYSAPIQEAPIQEAPAE